MIYAVLGGLVAALFSSLIVGYFTSAVKYVTDIFAVTFELNGLGVGELIFLLVSCLIMGLCWCLDCCNKTYCNVR